MTGTTTAERHLTNRELKVLIMLADGMETKDIAKATGVCFETIKSRRKCVLDKLGAANMVHAVALAMRKGLLS